MNNAKKELEKILEGKSKVKCSKIVKGYQRLSEDKNTKFILKINHTPSEFSDFLKSLDFRYDDGYGGQELYGTVWLEDNSWLSREDYNGSEWWQHNTLPSIPLDCI